MLEQTDATTNEVLEPITFVLAYPTVFILLLLRICCPGQPLNSQPPSKLRHWIELKFLQMNFNWVIYTKVSLSSRQI